MTPDSNFKTPILFIIFNRPIETEVVFSKIRKLKPKSLYVYSDGPRNSNDEVACNQAREIIRNVDWSCEIKTLFNNKNHGCKLAVSSAINWFFEHVEKGIILEDDCVPNESFFKYATELLDKFENDSTIMHINGITMQKETGSDTNDYYFSRLPHVWGWATWKRAWDNYSVTLREYSETDIKSIIASHVKNKSFRNKWLKIFLSVQNNEIDTWDYQWVLSCWSQNGKSITPKKNMIENIGFNSQATHTLSKPRWLRTSSQLSFPIKHPLHNQIDEKADEVSQQIIFPSRQSMILDIIKDRIKLS